MAVTPQHHFYDVAVVGGGAIGLAIGWRAAQRGLRTAVLERDEPGCGTSRVAAGMLAPTAEAAFGERALLALGRASARRYADFAAGLGDATDLDPGRRETGTLLVARDRDAAEALSREADFRRELGLPVTPLRPSEARRCEPALAPTIRAALDVPDDHAIDPRRLCAALVEAIRRGGGEVLSGAGVKAVTSAAGRVDGVTLLDGSAVAAGHVVIAAGVWSDTISGVAAAAGDRPRIRPVKGQILRLRDPAGPGLLGRVLRSADVYVVPRGDGRYVVGATMEERGDDTTLTAGAVHDLLRDAGELLPGVRELELEEASVGLRPGTPDNAPLIGAGELDGLIWATGHFRHGILLAPVTADIVAAILTGEEPPGDIDVDLDAFAPERFASRVETTA